MTVITNASDLQKKQELTDKPIFVGTVRLVPRPRPSPHYVVTQGMRSKLLCLMFFTTLMMLLAATMGLIYYNENHANKPMRYKGYCTIPMEVAKAASQVQKEEPASFRVPLRWSSEPDVTLFSNLESQSAGDAISSLLERFDIDDNVEKISVVNGGQNIEFIHDFNSNATGIVDSKRCFVMDLDPSAVLSPGVFVMHIESGSDFDVMRVQRRLRALIPAATASLHQISSILAERCIDRPTYQLEREEGNIIRKRSVDEPKQEYLHFAGKHLLEISIDNMADLIEYEKQHA